MARALPTTVGIASTSLPLVGALAIAVKGLTDEGAAGAVRPTRCAQEKPSRGISRRQFWHDQRTSEGGGVQRPSRSRSFGICGFVSCPLLSNGTGTMLASWRSVEGGCKYQTPAAGENDRPLLCTSAFFGSNLPHSNIRQGAGVGEGPTRKSSMLDKG